MAHSNFREETYQKYREQTQLKESNPLKVQESNPLKLQENYAQILNKCNPQKLQISNPLKLQESSPLKQGHDPSKLHRRNQSKTQGSNPLKLQDSNPLKQGHDPSNLQRRNPSKLQKRNPSNVQRNPSNQQGSNPLKQGHDPSKFQRRNSSKLQGSNPLKQGHDPSKFQRRKASKREKRKLPKLQTRNPSNLQGSNPLKQGHDPSKLQRRYLLKLQRKNLKPVHLFENIKITRRRDFNKKRDKKRLLRQYYHGLRSRHLYRGFRLYTYYCSVCKYIFKGRSYKTVMSHKATTLHQLNYMIYIQNGFNCNENLFNTSCYIQVMNKNYCLLCKLYIKNDKIKDHEGRPLHINRLQDAQKFMKFTNDLQVIATIEEEIQKDTHMIFLESINLNKKNSNDLQLISTVKEIPKDTIFRKYFALKSKICCGLEYNKFQDYLEHFVSKLHKSESNCKHLEKNKQCQDQTEPMNEDIVDDSFQDFILQKSNKRYKCLLCRKNFPSIYDAKYHSRTDSHLYAYSSYKKHWQALNERKKIVDCVECSIELYANQSKYHETHVKKHKSTRYMSNFVWFFEHFSYCILCKKYLPTKSFSNHTHTFFHEKNIAILFKKLEKH